MTIKESLDLRESKPNARDPLIYRSVMSEIISIIIFAYCVMSNNINRVL